MLSKRVVGSGLRWMLVAWLLTATGAVLASTGGLKPVGPDTREGNALLWKVERHGLDPSYVFATIHSEDERVTRLSAAVVEAFVQTDSFAMEMIPDRQALATLNEAMFLQGDEHLQDVAGQSLFQRTHALLAERGVSEALLRQLKPWAAVVALNMPRSQTGQFLDVMLYGAAVHKGMTIHGLESAQEQAAVFDNLNRTDQVAMLRAMVDKHEALETMNKRLVNAYSRGDLGALKQASHRHEAVLGERLAELFRERVIRARNHRMVERMVPRIEEGRTFIAIGALHLPGQEGVLRLLKQRGYRVTPVN